MIGTDIMSIDHRIWTSIKMIIFYYINKCLFLGKKREKMKINGILFERQHERIRLRWIICCVE